MVWIPSSNRYLVGLIVPEILAWNCLFTPIFEEFLGNIFPIWRHRSSWPPKGPSLGRNTSFEQFSVTISVTVRPGRRIEKNNITEKSQKCYISPIWGEPPLGRFDPKVAWWVTVGDVRDIITCAEFQIEIFMSRDNRGIQTQAGSFLNVS